jgi:hypothetical protein
MSSYIKGQLRSAIAKNSTNKLKTMDKIYCILDACGDIQTWLNAFWLGIGFIVFLIVGIFLTEK